MRKPNLKRTKRISWLLAIIMLLGIIPAALKLVSASSGWVDPINWTGGTFVNASTMTELNAVITGAANGVPQTITLTANLNTTATITIPANKIIKITSDGTQRTINANGGNYPEQYYYG